MDCDWGDPADEISINEELFNTSHITGDVAVLETDGSNSASITTNGDVMVGSTMDDSMIGSDANDLLIGSLANANGEQVDVLTGVRAVMCLCSAIKTSPSTPHRA